MSRSSYSAVPREEVPLQDVTLERGDGMASAVDSSSSSHAAEGKDAKRPLTKRTLYSAHRIEGRTPRLAGESDEDFKRRVHSQHLAALAHAVVWVVLAVGVLYYTDMINVVRYDMRINQTFLLLAGLSGGVLLSVVGYLALWVPLTAPRPVVDLGAYAPTAAPVGAASGVATFVFLCVAFWPVWGFVSLPILIVLSFAACLGPNLIPF